MSEHISEEYRQTYQCEFCGNNTLPSLDLYDAEENDAGVGVIIIRKHKRTGEETRRSVVCYQCMRKTDLKNLCTKDEEAFMSFTATERERESKKRRRII